MSVLYGPSGEILTKQKEVAPDLMRVHETEMDTEAGCESAARRVMAFQMRAAVDRAKILELVIRHDSRVFLMPSDEHGDRQVLFNGAEVKLKIHKDEAKRMGYLDPTDCKIPHYQEDL